MNVILCAKSHLREVQEKVFEAAVLFDAKT